jgi:phenylacetate-CoA ligase
MLPRLFPHSDPLNGHWFDRISRHRHLLPAASRAGRDSAELIAFLKELSVSERLPTSELQRQQRTKLRALAQHCVVHSPYFAARMKAAELTPTALAEDGGLARLPPMTRQQLTGAGDALFCKTCPPDHGPTGLTTTSGSTGEPVKVRRTGLCRSYWMACTMREHLWHDRDFAGRLAVLRANVTEPLSAPNWGPPCNLLFHTGTASAMPASSSVEKLCLWLHEFEPDYLLALPSALEAIIAEFIRTGQNLTRLRGLRTLSETVHPRLRKAARSVFGVPIHDSYTSQEGGIMATQCPEEGSYHVAETILLEVLNDAGQSCAPDETGRIVITDLINFATPLIRYEIGDYAEVGAPCPCGRGLPAIRRFLGRERNLVLLPDGTRHWPIVGFHRWAEVFTVRQFQFVQLDRTTILARMSAAGSPTAEQQARLTTIIQEALQHPFEIRFQWQETPLQRGPGGKFEEFLCQAK